MSEKCFPRRVSIRFSIILVLLGLAPAVRTPAQAESLIGYTDLSTNLPGGRRANVITMRAVVCRADGTDRKLFAAEIAADPNAWTQFAGWSPDGRLAIVGRGWESPGENPADKAQSDGRDTADRRYDMFLVDRATGTTTNVTAVDRVSSYNNGLFFWPGNPKKLGFAAAIGANSHPFRMDLDGKNKYDLTKDSQEFAYGFSASPDGRKIAYHKNYSICVADADGSNVRKIPTGQPFNFMPQWSPDGRHLLFISGEHYNCHPYVVQADGTGLRKLADRGGYRGVIEFLDVPDFHGGSTDYPVWSADGRSVFYTAKIGQNVELHRVALDGRSERLTHTPEGSLHYHPRPSPDGHWLAYGSKRDGVRQLFVMRLADGAENRLTNLEKGRAAMWPHWQPQSSE